MRILFLSSWFPYPHDNGSKLRVFNLLRGLAAAHEVTLFSLSDHPDEPIPQPLSELCRDVVAFPSRPYRPKSGRALAGLLSPRPRVLVDRHSPAMAARIQQAADDGGFDLIIASQWYMAAYLPKVQRVPAIFEEVEIGVFQDRLEQAGSFAGRFRHTLTHLKMRNYFEALLPRFAAATVASPEEETLLKKLVPSYHPVAVIPNGVSLADCSGVLGPPVPDQLVFAGSFTYDVNYQAMRWFCAEVLPRIRAQRPDVRLTITGDHAGLSLPYSRGVELAGMLPDVRPTIVSAWASLAPLQTGGGTRLKILEAMALGTPVIATSKGAEGLDVRPGDHLLIADSPAEFVAATVRLLSDPALRARLSESASNLIRHRYDWPVILPQFLALVDRVASNRPIDSPRLERPTSSFRDADPVLRAK